MIAFLFPGGGGQKVGMGRALAAKWPAAARVFEQADQALGWPLSRLCFEGPAPELRAIKNALPAIFTVSIAALRAVESAVGPAGPRVLRPDLSAGHSVGEYAALVCAGALDFADAVRLVRLRSCAMQDAAPQGSGAMIAVIGLAADAVALLCKQEGGEIAGYNTSEQIIVAGPTGAVQRVADRAVKGGGAVRELEISIPSHCSLMQPAMRPLAAALSAVTFHPPQLPVVTNVDAQEHSDGFAELLVQQIIAPVRWEKTVQHLAARGVVEAFELGGTTLGRFTGPLRVTSISEPEHIVMMHHRATHDLERYTRLVRDGEWRLRADGVGENRHGTIRQLRSGQVWRFDDPRAHGLGS